VVDSKILDKKIVMTRPIYPYPKKVRYDGITCGDPIEENLASQITP
jgi:hypothetical protein